MTEWSRYHLLKDIKYQNADDKLDILCFAVILLVNLVLQN